jgi:hypothetical protein
MLLLIIIVGNVCGKNVIGKQLKLLTVVTIGKNRQNSADFT